MTASGGAAGVGRAVNEAVVIAFMGVFAFNYVFTQTLLATHPELQMIEVITPPALARASDEVAVHASTTCRPVTRPNSATAEASRACRRRCSADGLARGAAGVAFLSGEIAGFCGRVMGLVYSGRVFKFFGEALRQAGILILGSALVIWGLVFILGLTCGIEGAYFSAPRAPPPTPASSPPGATCARSIPYAFGYMLAAKVGTGIVAELGAMRISDEIDALEVMGVPPVTFLAATRLLAAWLDPPVHVPGRRRDRATSPAGSRSSQQIGDVSSGGYFLIFWMFQNPPDLLFSLIKGMTMATVIVLVGCYYGYTASGGPVGVGTATAKSMVLNIVLVHIIGMMGTLVFWGANPRAPIGG